MFGWITYNSTYGYDQVEYLIIGRGLTEGYPLFSLVPSKGPGIYMLIGAFMKLGLSFGHASLSVVIAGVYAAMVTATFVVMRRLFDDLAAIAGSLMVGLCVLYMALTYLQPTGFVYLSGLTAYYVVLRNLRESRIGAFALAGLALGIGFQFKSVAAFYSAGLGLFLLLDLALSRSFAAFFRRCLGLGIGHALGLGLPFLYFVATGRGGQYIEWTFTFPLLHYPPTTNDLHTMYFKLGWFHALVPLAALWSLRELYRRPIWTDPGVQLAMLMGLTSYLALFKAQAPHYCFPGGAFYSIFIGVLIARTLRSFAFTRRTLLIIVATIVGLLAALLIGTAIHSRNRPNPYLRLITMTDYSHETVAAEYIRAACPPGSKALFIYDAQYLYWLAHRYPPVTFVNMNVQTAYLLRRDPDLLVRALDDPKLTLVEFSRRSFDKLELDENFDTEEFADLLNRFEARLKEDFVPMEPGPEKYDFWRRR